MSSDYCSILCLVLLFILLTVRRANGAQDLRNPAPDFSRHSIVQPVVLHGRTKREISTTRDMNEAHHPEVTISFPIDGEEDYILDLRLNRDLITDNHILSYQNNGKNVLYKPKKEELDLCHYSGSVRDKPGSWVAVSTCHGVQGIMFDGKKMRYIEPAQDGGLNSQHYVYDHSDLIDPNLRGYVRNEVRSSSENRQMQRRMSRSKRSADSKIHEPYNANKESYYVELALVADSEVYKENKYDKNAVHHQMLIIANYINALFSPLNIIVALVGVEVWGTDQITVDRNASKTLANFVPYKNDILNKNIPHDNAQLLVQQQFIGTTVGLGYIDTMCNEHSCAVAHNHTKNIALLAMTMAHEMGHNFGMRHDEKCECKEKWCIMNAYSSFTTHWSSCSLKTLKSWFLRERHNLNNCLRNLPKSLYESPTCGNGFVEPGEQCDCGMMIAKGAYNPCHACCDPNTCMLRANATCGAGMCCDLQTCRLKSRGTICRAAQECDLPEYCDGRSEYCPDDVYVMDSTRRRTRGMMCVNKECPSGCSGRGVCNSKGHCHCDAGYGPPSCAVPGPGGSYDSGPATDTTSMDLPNIWKNNNQPKNKNNKLPKNHNKDLPNNRNNNIPVNRSNDLPNNRNHNIPNNRDNILPDNRNNFIHNNRNNKTRNICNYDMPNNRNNNNWNNNIPNNRNNDPPDNRSNITPTNKNNNPPKIPYNNTPNHRNNITPTNKNNNPPKNPYNNIPNHRNHITPTNKNNNPPKNPYNNTPNHRNHIIPTNRNNNIPTSKNNNTPKNRNNNTPNHRNNDLPKNWNNIVPNSRNNNIPKNWNNKIPDNSNNKTTDNRSNDLPNNPKNIIILNYRDQDLPDNRNNLIPNNRNNNIPKKWNDNLPDNKNKNEPVARSTTFMIAMYAIFLGTIPALLVAILLFISRHNILQRYKDYYQRRLSAKSSQPVNTPGDPPTDRNTGGACDSPLYVNVENINNHTFSGKDISLPIKSKNKIAPPKPDRNINKDKFDVTSKRDSKVTRTTIKTSKNVNTFSNEKPNATDSLNQNSFNKPSLQTKSTVNDSLDESDFKKAISLVKLKPITNNSSSENVPRKVMMSIKSESKTSNLAKETPNTPKLTNENERKKVKPPMKPKPGEKNLPIEMAATKPLIKFKPNVSNLSKEKPSLSNSSNENEPKAKPLNKLKPNEINKSKEKTKSNDNNHKVKPLMKPKPNMSNLSRENEAKPGTVKDLVSAMNEKMTNSHGHIVPPK